MCVLLQVPEFTLVAKTYRALRRPERPVNGPAQSYYLYVLLHAPSYSEGFDMRALSIESLMSLTLTPTSLNITHTPPDQSQSYGYKVRIYHRPSGISYGQCL